MHKYLVEYLGTLFLMFVILASGNYIAIALTLAIGIMLGGSISGAAYNPAVTIALMYADKLQKSDLMPYIVCQIAGALTAVELVKRIK